MKYNNQIQSNSAIKMNMHSQVKNEWVNWTTINPIQHLLYTTTIVQIICGLYSEVRGNYFDRYLPRKHVSLIVSQRGGCVECGLAPDPCQTGEHNVICLLRHFATVLFLEVFRAQLEGSVHLSHCKVQQTVTQVSLGTVVRSVKALHLDKLIMMI